MTGRATRPADMPRQRGHQTSAPDSGRGGRTARVLAHPSGRPSGPGVPRPARRAPRTGWSGIADSAVGLLLVVATLMGTIAALAVVGAWWVGL